MRNFILQLSEKKKNTGEKRRGYVRRMENNRHVECSFYICVYPQQEDRTPVHANGHDKETENDETRFLGHCMPRSSQRKYHCKTTSRNIPEAKKKKKKN